MKLHKDDPRLLQFVLDEISAADRNVVLKAMAEQPEIAIEIQQLKKTFGDIESLSLEPTDMKLTAAQRSSLLSKTIHADVSESFLTKFRQSISIWTLSGGGLIAAMFAVLVFNNVLQSEKDKNRQELAQVEFKADSRAEPLKEKRKESVKQGLSGMSAGSAGLAAKKMESKEDLDLSNTKEKSLGPGYGASGGALGGSAAGSSGFSGSSSSAKMDRAKLADTSYSEVKKAEKSNSDFAEAAPAADSAQTVEPEVAYLEQETAQFQADEAPAEVAVSQSAPAAPAAAVASRVRPSDDESDKSSKSSAASSEQKRKAEKPNKAGLKDKLFSGVVKSVYQSRLVQLVPESEMLSSQQASELLVRIESCVPAMSQSAVEFDLLFNANNKTVTFQNDKPALSVAQKNCLIMKLGSFSWPKPRDYRFKVLSVSN